MRINSINSYNTTPLNFSGKSKDNKGNGLRNGAKAAILATALTAGAPLYQSCEKLTADIVHNHFLKLPTDTFTREELDPTPVPPQIIFIKTEVPGKTDTVIVHDTVPGTDSIKHDTIFVELPPKIVHDTLYLAGDTVYLKDEWTSPVPPKQEEIYEDLGITPNGNGKFFISETYYDQKNNQLVQRRLHGQGSSRDGKILVYNVVKTKWDDAAEGVVLGKNETFEKHLVYLSEDGLDLGVKVMQPKVDIKVSNNDKKSNWQVFSTGTLSTPDAWEDQESFFMQNKGGVIDLTNGFKLNRGKKDQSVTLTNPYNSEWELTDWNVIKGDPD